MATKKKRTPAKRKATKTQRWDYEDVRDGFERVGAPRKHRVDDFVYDVNHLLWICETMPEAIATLKREIVKKRHNLEALRKACRSFCSEFMHIKYHMPRANRVLFRMLDQIGEELGDSEQDE